MVCSCQYRCQHCHHSLGQLLGKTVCRDPAPGHQWLRRPTVMTTRLCVHSSGPGDHDGTRSQLAAPRRLQQRPVRTFAVTFRSICAATPQRHQLGPVGTIARPNPCIPKICTSQKSGTNHTRGAESSSCSRHGHCTRRSRHLPHASHSNATRGGSCPPLERQHCRTSTPRSLHTSHNAR